MAPNADNSTLSTTLQLVALAALLQRILTNNTSHKTKDSQKHGSISTQLGPWLRTSKPSLIPFLNPPHLLGPRITANRTTHFCGTNELHLCRLPQGQRGTTSWSVLLSVIHPQSVPPRPLIHNHESNPTKYWSSIPLSELMERKSHLHIKISRATLMTLLAITNARVAYCFNSSSGHRSAYPSYCGQWTISWPVGKECIVRLAPHDSHDVETDVYPPSFPARVDRCADMMAGIISNKRRRLAFPGRAKNPGPWILQELVKGYGGAHGSRHLYNMLGGKVFEVDVLVLVPCEVEDVDVEYDVRREIPCLGDGGDVAVLFIPNYEAKLLAEALDCLPWSSVSWSLHRGLRDVLLAYGKPTMDSFRKSMATLLKEGVAVGREILIQRGWALELIDGPMASMAESAMLSGVGNSGDVVRIVVSIVECLLEVTQLRSAVNVDKTKFWTHSRKKLSVESVAVSVSDQFTVDDMNCIVALTKFFVLEWSQEFDYQLYHQLPVDILLA